MVFSSPFFLFYFLPVTLLLTYLSSRSKSRNLILLLLSIFFYVFGEGELILVMLGSITINYFFGKWIGKSKTRYPIAISVATNLLILIIFKYTNFIIEIINPIVVAISGTSLKPSHIKLPVGISFYTFHAISYLIDVYRGKNKPQKSFIDLALYISLFPQLVAGPIIRYKDVALQFTKRILSSALFQSGIHRFIIGLGKKVIIANSLGFAVDQVFQLHVINLTAPAAWLTIIGYSLQLYFDFSGYSDMAIGLGRMLGFTFLENFNFPYRAKSIREFWQRWHISLSNWFRDYLYIPLGGNRVSPLRVYLNLSIVFFLTGLWHGPSWNFVVWGMIHGLFMIIERLGFDKVLNRLPRLIQHLYALLVVVVAWVFFRSEDFSQSADLLKAMMGAGSGTLNSKLLLNREMIFCFFAGGIMAFNGFNILLTKIIRSVFINNISHENFKSAFRITRTLFLIIVFIYSALIVSSGSYNPFIYFRF